MEELRNKLRTVDSSAPSIQDAASAMMKHYDKNTTSYAVTEWRNVLFAISSSSSSSLSSNQQNQQELQYLPLLYVANEVLQNSKRNRGNKFLEAFSPILLQSLTYMVQQIHSYYSNRNQPNTALQQVEKIRRVIKIWDQRRVFSTKYVNSLLTGLEPYRRIQPSQHHPSATTTTTAVEEEEVTAASFSPVVLPMSSSPDDTMQQQQKPLEVSHEDILGILQAHDHQHNQQQHTNGNNKMETDDTSDDLFGTNVADNDDDDEYSDDNDYNDRDNNDNDMFLSEMGNENGDEHRSLSLDVSDAVAKLSSTVGGSNPTATTTTTTKTKRRRRSSGASNSSHSNRKAPKRGSSASMNTNTQQQLSNMNFLEIWNQLMSNQQQYDIAINTIRQIENNITAVSNEELENLIGDELQAAVQRNDLDMQRLIQQKKVLHTLANERHALEIQAQRYVIWLEQLLQQDREDILFGTTLQEKIQQFKPIWEQLQTTRIIVRKEQQRIQEIRQEELRRQKEREENERFKRDVLAMQTEAKPGMVWNPTTREYQALNTDESWRD